MRVLQLNSTGRVLARVLCPALAGFSICLWGNPSPNAQFTVEIVTSNSATRTLIETNASWRYFKGRVDPNVGWDTADEMFLGSSWLTNLAGFGYGDGDDRTLLSDMQGDYSTLYLRTAFSYNQVLDPKRLKFRIDYDDGFIAYLDGKEFARVNAPGDPGQRPPHNSLATASHPPSRSPGGNAAETWYIGPDFPALFPHAFEGGDLTPHVLALQGLNRSIADGGFSIIPSLYVEDLCAVVTTSSVQLAGRITLEGAVMALVNGQPALVDVAAGTWSLTQPLHAGLNRLIIQARDCGNNVLASRTRDVVSKSSSRLVSGTISSSTSWEATNGIVEVTGDINVSAGATLTIGEGTTVLFRPGVALGTTSGTINVAGTVSNRVYFLPADGQTPWGGLAAREAGSSLTLRFAEIVAGGLYMTNNATVLLEDSTLRDFSYDQAGLERYLAYGLGYCHLTARRSVFSRYYTIAFGGQTSLQIEDCLFEYAEHDFLKPQDTTPDSVIRRCTFSHSTVAGTDGIDTGANAQLTVDGCVFYDIPDKAISIEASRITISNSLIYNCSIGLAVKDNSDVVMNGTTIANSTYGAAAYLKNPGATFAHVLGTNNIIWGNSTNITLRDPDTGSNSVQTSIDLRYSDVGGSAAAPGTGNIQSDPKFVNSPAGDFRLGAGSPALGAGLGGVNMGVSGPVGAVQPLVLWQQPLVQTAPLGSNVVLRIGVVGAPPILYQWRFNNVDLAGATGPSLVVSNLSTANQGMYAAQIVSGETSTSTAPTLVMVESPFRVYALSNSPCAGTVCLIGPAGKPFTLETSGNFTNWTPILTNKQTAGVLKYTEQSGGRGVRFYRGKMAP